MTHFVQLLGTRALDLVPAVESLGCRVQVIGSPEELSPDADVALASGVHYIIEPRFLSVPRLGIWGFHETSLPEGRGCAPLQWTVLNGKRELTVSFFELVVKFDTGRVLGQERDPISRTMLLEDLRRTARDLTCRLIERCLPGFLSGDLAPRDQQGEPSYYRKRTPDDSRIDLDGTLSESWDLLRVCDNDAFPAWFEIDGERFLLKLHRAEPSEP